MALSNQQLMDSLVSHQEEAEARIVPILAALVAILDDSESEVRVVLERYLSLLESPGVDLSSPIIQSQIASLRAEIYALRQAAFDRIDAEMQDLFSVEIDQEWRFLTELYAAALVLLELPGVDQKDLVQRASFLGRNRKEWLDDLALSDSNRITDTLVTTLIQNGTRRQALRSVLGDQTLNGTNGATHITRNALAALTATAFWAMISESRDTLLGWAGNSALLPRELYVAVLDSRTTTICRSLNGKVYPVGTGPKPPLHFHCRSVRVPLPPSGSLPKPP